MASVSKIEGALPENRRVEKMEYASPPSPMSPTFSDEEEDDDDVIICDVVPGKESKDELNNNDVAGPAVKIERVENHIPAEAIAATSYAASFSIHDGVSAAAAAAAAFTSGDAGVKMEIGTTAEEPCSSSGASVGVRDSPSDVGATTPRRPLSPSLSGSGSRASVAVKMEKDPLPSIADAEMGDRVSVTVKREREDAVTVKTELDPSSIAPKVEPKWEAGSVISAQDGVPKLVLRHVAFDRHPVIGGFSAPTDPQVVEALLAEVPPLSRSFARLFLSVKRDFLRCIWDSYERVESALVNTEDLRSRVENALNECHLTYDIQQRTNGNGPPLTEDAEKENRPRRQGIKTTLFVDSVQFCVVRSNSIEKKEIARDRDIFVAFVQKALSAVYFKIEDNVLRIGKKAATGPMDGAIRFDKLLNPEDIAEVSCWDLIKEFTAARMPKILVEKDPNEDKERDISFGSYESARKREPGESLASRLSSLSRSRTRTDFDEENRRKSRDDGHRGRRRDDDRRNDSRRSSTSVKRERGSPSGGRSDYASHSRVKSERGSPGRPDSRKSDHSSRIKEERRSPARSSSRHGTTDRSPSTSRRVYVASSKRGDGGTCGQASTSRRDSFSQASTSRRDSLSARSERGRSPGGDRHVSGNKYERSQSPVDRPRKKSLASRESDYGPPAGYESPIDSGRSRRGYDSPAGHGSGYESPASRGSRYGSPANHGSRCDSTGAQSDRQRYDSSREERVVTSQRSEDRRGQRVKPDARERDVVGRSRRVSEDRYSSYSMEGGNLEPVRDYGSPASYRGRPVTPESRQSGKKKPVPRAYADDEEDAVRGRQDDEIRPKSGSKYHRDEVRRGDEGYGQSSKDRSHSHGERKGELRGDSRRSSPGGYDNGRHRSDRRDS